MPASAFGAPVTLEVAGREVTISNPAKPLAPGLTKLQLAEYLVAVGEPLMRWIRNRPVMLERYPDGIDGTSFFQKRIPGGAPDWLVTTTVTTINGTASRALVIADLAHVLWAANLGVLGLHVWPFRVGTDGIDELRIDLDPAPGQTFEHVREAASGLRAYLDEQGLRSYPKTSGSKGLHVYVRLAEGYDAFAVRGAAVVIARDLAAHLPDLVTAEWWRESRGDRVFVDFNQNAPHRTMFGAWGVRPRPDCTVSTPFAWDELATVRPGTLDVRTVPARLAASGDPWADMDDEPQEIDHLVGRFADDLAAGVPDAPWPPDYPKMPDEPPRVRPSRARRSPDPTGRPDDLPS